MKQTCDEKEGRREGDGEEWRRVEWSKEVRRRGKRETRMIERINDIETAEAMVRSARGVESGA